MERYFTGSNVVGRAYWIGVNRTLSPNLYAYVDGGYLPQHVSVQPYAHWSWYQPRIALLQDQNCVRARADSSFDTYVGSNPADLTRASDIANYIITGANRRFGWSGMLCSSPQQYVCQVPAASFACPFLPPPLAPAYPPASPPDAPLQPGTSLGSCVPADNSSWACMGRWCYSYSMAQLIFPKAQEACRALRGELVQYTSLDQQVTRCCWLDEEQTAQLQTAGPGTAGGRLACLHAPLNRLLCPASRSFA